MQWWRRLRYRQILREIDCCFEGLSPYTVPNSQVYGEIEIAALLDLIHITRPGQFMHFADLGSGSGRAALGVKLRYPQSHITGIEMVPALCDMANQALSHYNARHPVKALNHVDFICDDFLNQALLGYTVIFVNATGFSKNGWTPIAEKLISVAKNTWVITTTHTLPETVFQAHYAGMEWMSWGPVSAYVYQKK